MPDERIIKIVVDVDDAKRKLDDLDRRLDALLGKASRVTVNTGNAATAGASSFTGEGVQGAAGGSIVPSVQRPVVTEGDLGRMAEQIVTRAVGNLNQHIVTAGQRYAGGLPLTVAPAAMGIRSTDLISSNRASSPAIRLEEEAAIGAGGGVINLANESRAAKRAAADAAYRSGQTLQATGTGGPTPIQMGAASGVIESMSPSGGGGGGGRGGGGWTPNTTGGRKLTKYEDILPHLMQQEGYGPGDTLDELTSRRLVKQAYELEAAGGIRLGGGGGGRGGGPPRDPGISPTGGVWSGAFGGGYGPAAPDMSMRGRFGRGMSALGTGISEGFHEGNMAAFNLLMGGWAIGSTAMPIEQVNAPALAAARQFSYSPRRAAVEQRGQRANIAYGQQVDEEQTSWDERQAAVLEWLASNNLGGASQNVNNTLGTVTGAANLLQGPALLAYAGRGLIRGGIAAGGGAIASGAGAIGGGVNALGAAAGAGAAAVGGVVGAGLGGLNIAERLSGGGQIETGNPFVDLARGLARIVQGQGATVAGIQFGGPAATTQAAPATGGYPIAPFRQPDIPLSPQQTIIARAMAEKTRTGTETGAMEFAAEQEMATRAATGYGIAGAQAGLNVSRIQMGISRRNFDEDQARERMMLDRSYGRNLTELSIGTLQQQGEIHIGAQQSRAAIGRGLGRSEREIGIGYGQSVEDINRSASENEQDILLGSALTGTAGALIRNRIARRRALAGAARGRDRALGGAQRGAGDSLEDVGIGEQQAIDASNRAYGYGVDAAGRGYQNAQQDQAEQQKTARQRYDEQEAIQKQLLQISQDEITLRKKLNDALEAGPKEVEAAYQSAARKLSAAAEKFANDWAGMLEGMGGP